MNTEELLETKAKLHRYKVRANFDKRYQSKGGVMQLERMIESADTLATMGAWFGISGNRMGVIVADLLGRPYSEYLAEKKTPHFGSNR